MFPFFLFYNTFFFKLISLLEGNMSQETAKEITSAVGIEVVTAVTVMNAVSWDVASCGSCYVALVTADVSEKRIADW
jgi:hypothetical protein